MSQQYNQPELFDNVQASLKQFCEDIKKFIHYGTYKLDTLYRGLDGKVSTAHIKFGNIRIVLRANEWSVNMPVEGNPVNPDLLDSWERQTIDEEIAYHKEQLDALIKRKKELE